MNKKIKSELLELLEELQDYSMLYQSSFESGDSEDSKLYEDKIYLVKEKVLYLMFGDERDHA